jgi:Flp pilus assembly protein TadD
MLRGDLKAARSKFQSALRRDPGNQTTLNNIKLLNSSQTFIERSPSGEPCGSVDCGQ